MLSKFGMRRIFVAVFAFKLALRVVFGIARAVIGRQSIVTPCLHTADATGCEITVQCNGENRTHIQI